MKTQTQMAVWHAQAERNKFQARVAPTGADPERAQQLVTNLLRTTQLTPEQARDHVVALAKEGKI